MSFLFKNSASAPKSLPVPTRNGTEVIASDGGMMEPRPALLEEKLKLHARIIDEFNLVLLEKLPRAELVKQVNAYVGQLRPQREYFT